MKNWEKYKNSKSIDRDTLIKIIEDIVQYRQLGYTQDEIDYCIRKDYGVQNPIEMRKYASFLEKMGQITINIDSKTTLDKIARAKNHQLVQQKINVKQRNLINAELNAQAYKSLILSHLEQFPYQRYSKCRKVSKKGIKTLNKGIFVIADEHFKGEMDVKWLNTMYDNIEQDIKLYKYKNVEIWYLGDGIDGLIHKGSLASNDGAIVPAITYCNILIERVNQIKEVSAIKFVNKSNHTETRPLGTNRNELAREDLGLMIGEMIKIGLRKDINFEQDDIIKFMEQGFNVALLHGHQPYAITKEKMLSYWNERYNFVPDLTIMGHYHTYKVNEYGKNKWLIVAPTAKQFNGDYENSQGFVSYGQYLILNFVDDIPQITVRRIKND